MHILAVDQDGIKTTSNLVKTLVRQLSQDVMANNERHVEGRWCSLSTNNPYRLPETVPGCLVDLLVVSISAHPTRRLLSSVLT